MKKRIVSIVLALALLCALLPVNSVRAANTDAHSSTSPVKISTLAAARADAVGYRSTDLINRTGTNDATVRLYKLGGIRTTLFYVPVFGFALMLAASLPSLILPAVMVLAPMASLFVFRTAYA